MEGPEDIIQTLSSMENGKLFVDIYARTVEQFEGLFLDIQTDGDHYVKYMVDDEEVFFSKGFSEYLKQLEMEYSFDDIMRFDFMLGKQER